MVDSNMWDWPYNFCKQHYLFQSGEDNLSRFDPGDIADWFRGQLFATFDVLLSAADAAWLDFSFDGARYTWP